MKNKSKICSLKIDGKNGRPLAGTAAQLRYINSRGGWDQHVRLLGREIGEAVAAQVSDALLSQASAFLPLGEASSARHSIMSSEVAAILMDESRRHVH